LAASCLAASALPCSGRRAGLRCSARTVTPPTTPAWPAEISRRARASRTWSGKTRNDTVVAEQGRQTATLSARGFLLWDGSPEPSGRLWRAVPQEKPSCPGNSPGRPADTPRAEPGARLHRARRRLRAGRVLLRRLPGGMLRGAAAGHLAGP